MSAHSYHIPVNRISSQTRKTEPVTTMVSTTPTSVAIKPMHPLPPTTIAHLESIFEAVKRQVSIWGENARWKIDLVLLPDEETESQNQTIEDMINPTSSTAGNHSPISENATLSSRAIYDSNSILQSNPRTEDDILSESNPHQSFSMLDDDSVDKLDIEEARRMLRDVMIHIRAYESILERSSREFGSKLKEANNRLKKANEHIEGMIKYHTMREKEKSSKHAVEIQLLQEDLRILSRKLKESNAQLVESRAKQASLQQEQEACRESYRVEQRSGQKERRSSRRKNPSSHNQPKQERVGQIVEYVPQQQTNGYLTYNFPYVRKIPQSTQMNQQLAIHNQIQSAANQQIIPSLYSTQSVRNPSFTASQNQQDLNGSVFTQYSISQNDHERAAYSAYSFRQSAANIMPTAYPMQLDNHVMNRSTEMSSYSSIQTNISAGSASYSAMRPNDHTGLDNLSLAAELILSSAVSSNTSKDQHNGQNIHSLSNSRALTNTREGISQITEQPQPGSSMNMGINTSQNDDSDTIKPEDFSSPIINCKTEAPVNDRTYLIHDPEVNGTPSPLRSFMSTESIKINKVDSECEGALNEQDEQSLRSPTPLTESHEDEPTVNDADLEGDCDLMDTEENIHEGESEERSNNNDVTSSHEESDDTPNPSSKRPTSLKRVPPVQIF
ncbi:hypothetical protein C2G38_2149069 [Gigaspora rosea]|uniref:Uncharacterized protein n=1 Tax=Gigaspora rosea TaxID=44941 RepID=A0A397U263_9GLOM|nr:hypothetical protein C2G38_2149069 [Gigaspora rosea]